jgi:hypothetical protein
MTQPGAEAGQSDNTGQTDTPDTTQQQQPPAQQQGDKPEMFEKSYVEELRREAAKYRSESKAKDKRIAEVERQGLTEAQKAIAEARDEAALQVRKEFGVRLTRAEFSTAAATAQVDITDLLDDLDLSKFVTDDGEPDSKRISATVSKFAALKGPAKSDRQSFDGGVRATAKTAPNMNDFIRNQLGITPR